MPEWLATTLVFVAVLVVSWVLGAMFTRAEDPRPRRR